MQYASYHDLLSEEFEKRRQMNESYSLRAYARDLGLAAPRLSQILNKKQGLSVTSAEAVAKKLRLNHEKTQWFCSNVGSLHSRSSKQRLRFQKKALEYKSASRVLSEIQLEYFKVISDWYHFAILELTYLDDFQNDNKWMAEILGIEEKEVESAIKRLKNLELLEESEGKLVDKFKFLETPNDIPSLSLKKFHTQLLKKANIALYEQNVEEREISSNIFAVDKKRLPELKERLRDFRREFDMDVSKHENKNAVYCLGIQFFDITRRNQ